MVGELNRPHCNNNNNEGDGNSSRVSIGVRLTSNHNIGRGTILELIKSSLEPLQTDPIPERIVIGNIHIYREESGHIAITCEVSYE